MFKRIPCVSIDISDFWSQSFETAWCTSRVSSAGKIFWRDFLLFEHNGGTLSDARTIQSNMRQYSCECRKLLTQMSGNTPSNACRHSFDCEKCSLDAWNVDFGCMNTVNWMHEKYTRGNVKLPNRICENTQLNTWSILSNAWKHTLRYMRKIIWTQNYSYEYLEILHRIYDATRSNGQRYIFGYLKHRLGCVNVINRIYENTFVVV